MMHRCETLLADASGPTGASARAGRRRHVPLDRAPHAAAPRGRARPPRGLLDARRRRRGRRDRPRPRRARRGRDGPALPEEGNAARPVLALGQHAAAAVGGDRRGRAVVRRSGRADRVDLPRLREPQARARSRRLRRPAPVLARGRGRRPPRPAARVRDRSHLRRRVPGRQRAAGRRAARVAPHRSRA